MSTQAHEYLCLATRACSRQNPSHGWPTNVNVNECMHENTLNTTTMLHEHIKHFCSAHCYAIYDSKTSPQAITTDEFS